MAPSVKSTGRTESLAKRLGIYLLSFATVGAGILDLIWRDFDPGHQPFGGVGYYMPARALCACIAGIWLIVGGSITLWPGTQQLGRFAMATIYLIFGLLSLPHFYTVLHKYGFHFTLIVGVIGQVFLQLIVVAGCLVTDPSQAPVAHAWSRKSQLVSRWMFGVGGVLTGWGHLINTKGLVHMIPKWMPFGAPIWIVISGIGFILAGVAILIGILDLLATRLLALMLFLFQIILVPIIFEYPHVHQAWGGTAFNLAAAGSTCIFAASLAFQKAQKNYDLPHQIAGA